MKVRFLEIVLSEIDEALEWYKVQDPTLPLRIIDEIHSSLGKLNPFPEAFRSSIESYRKLRLVKFPYALFFKIEESEIIITAFVHLCSDPKKWNEILKNR